MAADYVSAIELRKATPLSSLSVIGNWRFHHSAPRPENLFMAIEWRPFSIPRNSPTEIIRGSSNGRLHWITDPYSSFRWAAISNFNKSKLTQLIFTSQCRFIADVKKVFPQTKFHSAKSTRIRSRAVSNLENIKFPAWRVPIPYFDPLSSCRS